MGSHCSGWSGAVPSRPGGQEVPHGGDAGPGLGFCQQRWDMEVVLRGDKLGWRFRPCSEKRGADSFEELEGTGKKTWVGLRRWRKVFRGRAWKGPRQGDPQGGRYLPRSTVKFTAQ